MKNKYNAFFLKEIHIISIWLPLSCLSIITTLSCTKFVKIPSPPNQLVTATVFADSLDANAAILGIYINMMPTSRLFTSGGITIYTGLSSDELFYNTGNSDESQFYSNSISPISNGANDQLWVSAYELIYQTNACIEGLNASNGLSVSLKKQLVGEALFIRAFLYFNLTNIYGSVPLVTSTDYKINAVLPRASSAAIYMQIDGDLNIAQSFLPQNYGTTGNFRPNQFAATSLLARVYLYQRNWDSAEIASSRVINSGNYNLVPILNDVFLAGSNEGIWQLVPVFPGLETTEGYYFVPSNVFVVPKYTIGPYLLNTFESGDQRRVDWIDSNVVNGVSYYYPYKYKLGYDGNSSPIENYMVLRLAEQYLIRAEAEANGAAGGSNAAIGDLNVVRNRAGLPNYLGSTSPDSVLNSIYHERKVELFCEWGHRWFDLKRTSQINAVLGTEKVGWEADAALYPIPSAEIQLNPYLTQNDGYEN